MLTLTTFIDILIIFSLVGVQNESIATATNNDVDESESRVHMAKDLTLRSREQNF